MWTFQYKHGDRPLDGFTIQRAAGRGGFGEVYYAVSDSGREVALKAVTGYEQIEVRGISQCMNLKSPHLVTIFDVKYNDQGKPFVIMEFVSGPNLRQLLDESPAGLGTQKAAFFLREIGKGLTFLHDCGIVHRDLKPANIFFENGYVKIGDYGLSKAISPTQHSGQTVTVGTVHYMAPEVGAGKYDRSIDIYAMGAVLYEMLTGTVPFIGASPSEILIKHLQADPDCAGIPEPFCTVIKKAMAKDPAQRYANVQEMVEAVFGAAHVQMSVSHFSPDDLSMVAAKVAQKIGVGSGGPGSAAIGGGGLGGTSGSSSVIAGETVNSRNPNRFADDANGGRGWKNVMNQPFEQLRNRMDQLGGSNAASTQPLSENGINDPLSIGTRCMLGLLTAVVVAIAANTLIDTSMMHRFDPIGLPLFVFTAVCGATVGVLVGWRRIAIPKLSSESHAFRKLVVGSISCGLMLLMSGFFWIDLVHHNSFHNGNLLAMLAPLVFSNTWKWVRANRAERISIGPPIEIGIFGVVLSWFCNGDAMLSFAVLAGICLAAQVIAPWDPLLAKRRSDALRAKAPGAKQDERERATFGNVTADAMTAVAGTQPLPQAQPNVYGNFQVQSPNFAASWTKPARPTFAVWQHAPLIWMLAAVLLFSLGLTGVIVGASGPNGQDAQSILIGLGTCGLINALFCFVRGFKKRYSTIWAYLVRPLLTMACINLIILFSILVASEGTNPDGFSVFMIILSSIGFLTIPFLRLNKKISSTAAVVPPPILNPNLSDAAAPSSIPPIPPIPPMPPKPSLQSFRTNFRSNMQGWRESMRDYRDWQRLNRAQQLKNGKGLLSVLTGWLILLSLATTFTVGLDLPLAVSLGLPDKNTAQEIRSNVSLGVNVADSASNTDLKGVVYPSAWSILVTKLLLMADIILIAAAIMSSLIARSGSNFLHLLRAPVGIIGLILATACMAANFEGKRVWPNIAHDLLGKTPHPDQAISAIIDAFQNPATMFAIPLFITCIVILGIRPRDRSKNATKGAT